MPELQCIVVTPEQTVRETAADFVALTLFDGEIGIAPGHSPLIGRLGYGEMRIKRGGQTDRYYVAGGFVEVVADVVTILTSRAVRAEDLTEAAAREQLEAATARPGGTAELTTIRDQALAQGRAQLRMLASAK